MSLLERRVKRLEQRLNAQKEEQTIMVFAQRKKDGTFCWNDKEYPDMDALKKASKGNYFITWL